MSFTASSAPFLKHSFISAVQLYLKYISMRKQYKLLSMITKNKCSQTPATCNMACMNKIAHMYAVRKLWKVKPYPVTANEKHNLTRHAKKFTYTCQTEGLQHEAFAADTQQK